SRYTLSDPSWLTVNGARTKRLSRNARVAPLTSTVPGSASPMSASSCCHAPRFAEWSTRGTSPTRATKNSPMWRPTRAPEDPGRRGKTAVGGSRDLLDRQGGVCRSAGRILDRLQPKHCHEPLGAHLLDPPAEALDLLHEGLQPGDAGGGDLHGHRLIEIRTEHGHVTALPLRLGRAVAHHQLDRIADTVGRLGRPLVRTAKSQLLLLDSVTQPAPG